MKKAENILIVCTYEELVGHYKKALQDLDLDIDIEFIGTKYGTDMTKVLKHIGNFKEKGKEIIITRGFMAQEVRKHLNFKVIEITITGLDVLAALQKYANRGITIGIVESKSFIDIIVPVAELLGIQTKSYEVNGMQDFYDFSKQAVEDGVDVICGGAMKFYDDYFTHLGVGYEAIDSTEISIKASLFNALAMYEMVEEEKEKKKFLESIVDIFSEGIIAIDSKRKILAMNDMAEEICHIDGKEAIGKKLYGINSQIDMENLLNSVASGEVIAEIFEKKVLVSRIPITFENKRLGFVLKMTKAKDIQEADKKIRKALAEKGLQARYCVEDIKGKNEKTKRSKEWVSLYAKRNSTMLIMGETGTGKEIFAQAIHNASDRKNSPFLAINCSAFHSNLLDSELFGYVEGAFTGARKSGKPGVFELAHTGTIFLDEIGDMDISLQARLLRVIQEKEVMRIGDDKVISVDVRIIAATNKNLLKEVLEGRFREDLYYRLNVLNINIPPLRDRKEDIEELAEVAVKNLNKKIDYSISGIDADVIERMKTYSWYGNVRELNNFIEKMSAIVERGKITYPKIAPLFEEMDEKEQIYRAFYAIKSKEDKKESTDLYQMTLKEAEVALIENALEETEFNKTKASQKLGIDRVTLNRKINRE